MLIAKKRTRYAVDGDMREEDELGTEGHEVYAGNSRDDAVKAAGDYVAENAPEVCGGHGPGSVTFELVSVLHCAEDEDGELVDDEVALFSTMTEEVEKAWDKAYTSYRKWCDYEGGSYTTVADVLGDSE